MKRADSLSSNKKMKDTHVVMKNTRKNLIRAAMNSTKWVVKDDINILTLGITGAGKSTLMEFIQYSAVKTKKRRPTLSFERNTYEYRDIKLNFVDAPGQKVYWDEWKDYISHADAILFVIDSANFTHISMLNFLIYKKLKLHHLKIPVLFLANKQDLFDSISGDKIHKMLNFDKFPNTMRVFDITAITGAGIMTALQSLVRSVQKNKLSAS